VTGEQTGIARPSARKCGDLQRRRLIRRGAATQASRGTGDDPAIRMATHLRERAACRRVML